MSFGRRKIKNSPASFLSFLTLTFSTQNPRDVLSLVYE